MMASMGARTPADLKPWMLRQVVSPTRTESYETLYEWLEPGQLLTNPPESWAREWAEANPHSFHTPIQK